MITRIFALSSAGLLCLAAPQAALADDHQAPISPTQANDALRNALSNMFEADPLTQEQQARLPAALKIIDQVFPVGTYRTMMDESVKPMMSSMFGATEQLPVSMMGGLLGLSPDEVTAMGDTTIGEVMAIMDPAFEQRTALSAQLSIDLLDSVVDTIEPPVRAGLARAYAVKFTDQQLEEMHAFFSTETGSYFASQSFLIFTDPQVMAAMSDMMPVMMEQIPPLAEKLEADMAELPAPRQYSDLTAAQRSTLADLLGMTPAELEERQNSLFARPNSAPDADAYEAAAEADPSQ